MASDHLDVVVVDYEDRHVVMPVGELDIASAPDLVDRLEGGDHAPVVVDLAGLSFIDAAGVASLVTARRRILDQGHGIELVNAGDMVRRVFRTVDLEQLLTD